MSSRHARTRKQTGSALTEIGPALFFLVILIFFPMLDLMGMMASYCSCLWLNMQQVKQAAVVPSTDALSPNGQVQKTVVDNWLSAGIGKFVKTTKYPTTNVSYHNGQQDPNTNIVDKYVVVKTVVSCQPFLTIPAFFVPVPGLSAPMTFTFSSQASMENPDNAG